MYQLIVVNIKVGLHAKISLSFHTHCKVNVPFLINQRALRVPFLIVQRALKVPFFYKVTVPFFVPGVNTTLMAVTAELMAIIMNINDRTHKTINFKKRKVMDDFNRNLIINGIFMDF